MSGIILLNSDNFDDYVLNGKLPAVVDFSAEWCGPCKRMHPILEEIAKDYQDLVHVCKLDVDEAEGIASRYQVSTLPSLLFFLNGEIVERTFGLVTKEKISEMIGSSLISI